MQEVDGGPTVSRRTRWLLYAFLLVFAVTGVGHMEVYPFSGFRLFSELRSAERESWQLRAVDGDGGETPIRLADLPIGYRNSTLLLRGFDDLPPDERDDVCDAWAEPLRDRGVEVVGVRVYAVVESLRPEGPPPRRTLAYECGRPR
jgi:hypothetical protein